MFLEEKIGRTADFRRIRDLPRRKWQEDPNLEELRILLTKKYKYDHSKCKPLCHGCRVDVLNGAQATFIREGYNLPYGAFGSLRAGAGKTLVSFLLPAVISTPNPWLVIPAAQEDKTRADWLAYGRHWQLTPVNVVTYEFLSHPKNLNWFWSTKPTMLICDESHKLKSSGAKAWKRMRKYLEANPQVKAFFMTGSGAGRKLGEYWHYVNMCLKDGSPLPKNPMEFVKWGYALDEKIPEEYRLDPGALFELPGHEDEEDTLRRARLKYRDRFVETYGVISTLEDVPPVGLKIWTTTIELPKDVQANMAKMRKEYTTPGGDQFKYALELWRHCRSYGAGVYQVWRPPPPLLWRTARGQWYSFVREKLRYAHKFDAELHLIAEIEAGNIDDGGLLKAWRAVESLYNPDEHKVDVWAHDAVLDYAEEWLKNNRGLVWTQYPLFGEKLEQRTGVPYFREGGLSKAGKLVDNYDGSAIVSIDSCSEGHNLQVYNSANLVIAPMSTGAGWEQLLARTHRDGQEADEVTCEVVLTSKESYRCLAQAYRDAVFATETSGQPQRLCYAEKHFGPEIWALIEEPEEWKDEYGI